MYASPQICFATSKKIYRGQLIPKKNMNFPGDPVWCCHLLYVFTTKKGNSIWLFMIWVFCKINMTKWLHSSQLQSHSSPLLPFLFSKQFYFSQRFPILSNHSEGITDYTTCPAILKFEICFWTHIPTIRLKISMW